MAIVEAKRAKRSTADGIGQAKVCTRLLDIPFAYAANGEITVRVDMAGGKEEFNALFPTPEEAWNHFQVAKGLRGSTERSLGSPEFLTPARPPLVTTTCPWVELVRPRGQALV